MLKLDHVSKIFETPAGSRLAVDRISLELGRGEIGVVLGPSGAGKSTLLKLVNRLLNPTSGKVVLAGLDTAMDDEFALRRRIGYLGAAVGLFPAMSVADNIALVPRLLAWDEVRVRRRVDELLEQVNLAPDLFRRRYPRQLSAGEQRRVGLARALAAEPPLALFDEPCAGLDVGSRLEFQAAFQALHTASGVTVLWASDLIDEALKLATRIAVLHNGRLEQYAAPGELLAHPASRLVTELVGDDRMLKRLRLLRVQEAMFAQPPSVRAEDSLEQAQALMLEHGYDNIVMVGPRGRARGVVPLALTREKRGACGEHRYALTTTVNSGADLGTALSLMFRHDQTWLACVDDDGFYRGYLTQQGITHTLSATYRATAADERA